MSGHQTHRWQARIKHTVQPSNTQRPRHRTHSSRIKHTVKASYTRREHQTHSATVASNTAPKRKHQTHSGVVLVQASCSVASAAACPPASARDTLCPSPSEATAASPPIHRRSPCWSSPLQQQEVPVCSDRRSDHSSSFWYRGRLNSFYPTAGFGSWGEPPRYLAVSVAVHALCRL